MEDDHSTNTAAYRRSMSLTEGIKRARAAYGKATVPIDQDHREEDDDGPAMRARFEDWVKQQGRTYRDEEEKAWRFAIFKAVARCVDAANAYAIEAGHNTTFGLNNFSDWNAKEIGGLHGALPISDDLRLCMHKPRLVKQGIWNKVVADRKAAGEVTDCGSVMKKLNLQICMRRL